MISGQHNTRVTHNSVHRTAFAERASPPVNPVWLPLKGIACAIGALIVLSLLDSVIPLPPWLGIAAFAAILLFVVWGVFAFLRLPDYRARRERWTKSWICAACGNTFVPQN
jgi:membrane protein YdbS with pleckstrin-like domain